MLDGDSLHDILIGSPGSDTTCTVAPHGCRQGLHRSWPSQELRAEPGQDGPRRHWARRGRVRRFPLRLHRLGADGVVRGRRRRRLGRLSGQRFLLGNRVRGALPERLRRSRRWGRGLLARRMGRKARGQDQPGRKRRTGDGPGRVRQAERFPSVVELFGGGARADRNGDSGTGVLRPAEHRFRRRRRLHRKRGRGSRRGARDRTGLRRDESRILRRSCGRPAGRRVRRRGVRRSGPGRGHCSGPVDRRDPSGWAVRCCGVGRRRRRTATGSPTSWSEPTRSLRAGRPMS